MPQDAPVGRRGDDIGREADGTPPRRHWPALAAVGVASAVWTATYLRHSWRNGRLAFTPLYDDVTYLLDGARRVAGLHEGGLVGLVRSLAEYPPKSLIAMVHATVAFLLFGTHEWAPYLFNVFVVFALLVSAEWAMRPLPVWPRVGACLLLLACPMLGRAVNEFRPDFYAAFALAVSVFAALDRPLLGSSRGRLFLLGFLVGVSVAAKPTATPAVLVLSGMAFGLAIVIDLPGTARDERVARAGRAIGWLAFGASVLPLVYAPFGAESTWNYVEHTLLGPGAELWTPDLTPEEGLLYYLTGAGGRHMLGRYALPLLALALFGLGFRAAVGTREDRWRSAALFSVLLASWAIPTLTPIKAGLFGLQFDAVLILLAARGAREVLTPLTVIRGVPVAIPLAAVIAAAAVWLAAVKLNVRGTSSRAPHIRDIHALYDQVFGAIRDRLGAEKNGGDVFLTFSGYVNKTNLSYRAARDRVPIRFDSREGVKQLKQYRDHLKDAELVLALTSGTGHEVGRFPSLKLLDDAIDMLDADPEFERVGVFPVTHLRPGVTPGRYPPAYILYARRAPAQPTAEAPGAAGAPPP